MPTIIDSLVIELGLDASKLSQGQKEAVESLRGLEEGARRHVDPVEKGFKDLLGTFKEVQGRLLAIGAIIAAGLGFNRMTQEVTKANNELGYLSKTLDMSAQDLSAWENVGRQVGATTNDISSGLRSINSEIQEFHATGRSQLGSLMGQLGIKPLQKDDNAESVAKRLSAWYVQQPDKAFASHLLQSRGGLSQGMINLLSLGPEEIQKRLDQAKRFAPTDQEIKQFQELTKAWGELLQVVDKLERSIVEAFTPAMINVLKLITEWLDKLNLGKNPADVAGEIAAKHGFSELAPNAAKPSLAHRAWSWIKGKFGAGGEGGADQGAAAGGAAGGGAANDNADGGAPTGQVNGTLAEQRARFAEELKNNPALRDKIMRIAANEQGSNPQGTQAILESMMNRAIVRGTSLEAQARWHESEGGYYQQGNMGVGALENARHRRILEQSLNNTLAGGNVSNYATDNSSQDLAAREKASGTFAWRTDINGESLFGPATAEPMLARRWQSWKERTEAQEAARKAANAASRPAWMSSTPGAATGSGGAAQSFQNWRNLGLGSRGALMRGGDSSTTNNNNTSSTNIHSMNVTVPHGADPSAYADGISRRLADYNNIQHSNTGLV